MGMFDYVRCEVPLPDGEPTPPDLFQTKDFDFPYMNHYTITAARRLVAHRVRYEEVPLSERPNPDADGLLKWRGSVRAVPIGDEDLNWHGFLHFGHFDPITKQSRQFRAKFTDGNLVEIAQLSEDGDG